MAALALHDWKGTGSCGDRGGQGEVVLGTGFPGATGGHRHSPPSRVGAEQRSHQPPACSAAGDVSVSRLGI